MLKYFIQRKSYPCRWSTLTSNNWILLTRPRLRKWLMWNDCPDWINSISTATGIISASLEVIVIFVTKQIVCHFLKYMSNKVLPYARLRKSILHCVKSVRIRSFSGPYFQAFGLNMERYGVSFLFKSDSLSGKIYEKDKGKQLREKQRNYKEPKMQKYSICWILGQNNIFKKLKLVKTKVKTGQNLYFWPLN